MSGAARLFAPTLLLFGLVSSLATCLDEGCWDAGSIGGEVTGTEGLVYCDPCMKKRSSHLATCAGVPLNTCANHGSSSWPDIISRTGNQLSAPCCIYQVVQQLPCPLHDVWRKACRGRCYSTHGPKGKATFVTTNDYFLQEEGDQF